jgi:hypothetical protein
MSRRADTCHFMHNLRTGHRPTRDAALAVIYDAKSLLRERGRDLPRVTVRIATPTEDRALVLGAGRMGGLIIWISPEAAATAGELAWVVLHELGHAVLGLEHTARGLMAPTIPGAPTVEEARAAFLEVFTTPGALSRLPEARERRPRRPRRRR